MQAQTREMPKQAVTAQGIAPALSFEELSGHFQPRFVARGSRATLTLRMDAALLALNGRSQPGTLAVEEGRIEFAGANREPAISGEEELPGKVYHASGDFIGPLSGNPTFRRVRYSQLYRGIDAVFYGNERELEFELQCSSVPDRILARRQIAAVFHISGSRDVLAILLAATCD
jgi:hypothetical protein